jgi:hypothetical protein
MWRLGVLAIVLTVYSGMAMGTPGDQEQLADSLSPADSSVAAPGAAAAPAPAERTHENWKTRYGPAYPGDFWTSFGRDGKEMPETLWDDTKATFTDSWALVGLAAAGISGLVIGTTGPDETIADHYTKHGPQLNTFWDTVGDAGGNPGTHFAVAGTMYFGSLAGGDDKTYEVSKTLLNALVVNDLLTVGLKAAVRSDSPNGDAWGWPSGHTSSTFTLATVLAEEYGPWVGVPLFGFASYVGYERIDARNHDFSDVISGALIGMAVGHAVANRHQTLHVAGFEVLPYASGQGGAGLALVKQW